MSHRRAVIVIAAASACCPMAARAQPSGKAARVGIIWIAPESVVAPFHEAFRQGLRDLGHVEGRTVTIEARFANGRVDQLPELAAEMVRLKADVIVAPATPIVHAARQATNTIPIVMANVADPVGFGYVASLREPGGNVTGVSNLMVEQVGKNIELCKEVIPRLSRMAVLANPAVPDAVVVIREARAAGRTLRFEVEPLEARRPDDLAGAIAKAREWRADAMLVSTIEGFFFAQRTQIIDAGLRHRLPTVFAAPPFGLASAGALLSYGANTPDMLRRSAGYVDKILKGAKPATLPVEQPVKFELGVNLKTARALGLTIPKSILVRADEVVH